MYYTSRCKGVGTALVSGWYNTCMSAEEKKTDPGKRLRLIEESNPVHTSSDEEVQRAFRRRGGSGRLDPGQIRVVRGAAGKSNTLRDVADIAGEASLEVSTSR